MASKKNTTKKPVVEKVKIEEPVEEIIADEEVIDAPVVEETPVEIEEPVEEIIAEEVIEVPVVEETPVEIEEPVEEVQGLSVEEVWDEEPTEEMNAKEASVEVMEVVEDVNIDELINIDKLHYAIEPLIGLGKIGLIEYVQSMKIIYGRDNEISRTFERVVSFLNNDIDAPRSVIVYSLNNIIEPYKNSSKINLYRQAENWRSKGVPPGCIADFYERLGDLLDS
jgi:hypothetical protein